jgi:hypothetical protein
MLGLAIRNGVILENFLFAIYGERKFIRNPILFFLKETENRIPHKRAFLPKSKKARFAE